MNTEFAAEDIATIVNNALDALLWSEGEEYDESGVDVIGMWDETYDRVDAAPELHASLFADVSLLLVGDTEGDETLGKYRIAAYEYISQRGLEAFGHDMTLTRNGHGAGFWDRGMGEIGDVLTDWAKGLGTLSVFHGTGDTLGMFDAE